VVDRALVALGALVVIDTFVRVMLFSFVFKTSDAMADFTGSEYAFFMQISGGVLGLCFALAALGSVLVDILARYRDAAEHDPLTALLNRRGFEDALERMRPGKARDGVVLTCDIDHFKQINDTYGHAAGDLVIVALAAKLRGNLPAAALAARFGGEEFIGYVPGVTLAEGKVLAQRICDLFAASRWQAQGIDRGITVSFGVATVMAEDRSIHDAIARADRALYLAKAAGRNQVASETALPVVMGLRASAA
jgi:diguanylate cyclase (GGDEF)-like protein